MPSPAPLPRYRQISDMLIRDIAAGRLADGERLPPERQLAETLGIAVGTLRHAIADLAERGLIRRVQGSGNYVCGQPGVDNAYAFFRLELPEGGGLPTARVLEVTYCADPAGPLKSGFECHAHRIRRLRFLSGRPAAVEDIWLDAAHDRRFHAEDLLPSLYLFYRQKLGIVITRVEDRIGIGPAPAWTPVDFGVTAGTLLPYVRRLAWDDTGRMVETSHNWINPAHAHYVARLK